MYLIIENGLLTSKKAVYIPWASHENRKNENAL